MINCIVTHAQIQSIKINEQNNLITKGIIMKTYNELYDELYELGAKIIQCKYENEQWMIEVQFGDFLFSAAEHPKEKCLEKLIGRVSEYKEAKIITRKKMFDFLTKHKSDDIRIVIVTEDGWKDFTMNYDTALSIILLEPIK